MSTAAPAPAPAVVCVTGASGFLASWLVKLLLERGYSVNATVLDLGNPVDFDHLKAFEGAEERLHLFQANLNEEGSFDAAVEGCVGVFHTASPVFYASDDPQGELIDPTVNGTLNVLRSCSKVPSIRRVVLTSTISTVVGNQNPRGEGTVIDETWFSDPDYCLETKQWYRVAKTLAEKAAWKYAEENGIDLITLHPSHLIGPLLQPTLNFTSALFIDIIKGKEQSPYHRFSDVRDVALAHIAAFENPSAASGRYCLVQAVLTHSDMMKILHELYPSIFAPPTVAQDPTHQVSKKKAETLVRFRPVEESLRDIVESLKEKKFLSL